MKKENHIQLLNKVKERLLILSPTVKAGLERECNKGDFYREGDKCIGKGGFGEVWKVVHKKTNKTYVIKVIDKKSIKNQNLVSQMNREIEIMYQVHHPHLMQLINHFEDDDKFFMIMPFAARGQLYTLLRRQVRFDQRTAAQYMRETIAAVKYLHEHKIIHRDIKPENLLLDSNYRVMLSDFGWSNFKEDEDTRKTYCGTPEYLAPEMVKKLPHDYNIDIWSLGVLLFEFLAGYAPFTGTNQNELFNNIKRLKINWPVDFPPLAKNLVTRILKLNPKERPSLDEISAHSWFEQNPPYRPVLVNTLIDPKEILESHLVNVSPEMVKVEIDTMVNSKIKNSINMQRQISNGANVTEVISQNSVLKSENENLKKEITELRAKINQLDSENKSLKNEITKIKDTVISNNNIQINKLTEEVQKYKILNNERLALLSEIEQKNNTMIEINTKFRNMELEKDSTTRENNNTLNKIKDLNNRLNEKLEEVTKLEARITELQNEKIELNSSYQKRLKDIQNKMFDKVDETNNGDCTSLTKIIELLIESINDFKNNFGKRFESFEEFKENYTKNESSIKDLLEVKSKEVLNLIQTYKSKMVEEYMNSQKKIEEHSPSKTKEIIEWYKKQNSELYEYKNKSIQSESKLNHLQTENNQLKKQMEMAIKEKALVITNDLLKNDKINKLNEKIEQLESKIEDIVLYVVENTKTKPEKFFSEFKSKFCSKNPVDD